MTCTFSWNEDWIWPQCFDVLICVNRFTHQITFINDKADFTLSCLQIHSKERMTVTYNNNIYNALSCWLVLGMTHFVWTDHDLGSGLIWHDMTITITYVLMTGLNTYIIKALFKTLPVSHGNSPPPPPPEIIPYGKPSPGRNPMAELPQGETMVNPPHTHNGKSPPHTHTHTFHDEGTNTMADCPPGNDTIWQMFPMKEYHIMANLPPGRNPTAEFTQGGIIPYGKASPSVANTNSICNIGTACAIYFIGGGGGGDKSHRWETFTIWYFITANMKQTIEINTSTVSRFRYPGERNPWGRKSHVTPCAWMCGQQNTNRVAVEYRDILISWPCSLPNDAYFITS